MSKTSIVAVTLLFAGTFALAGCAGETSEPAPEESNAPVAEPEAKAEQPPAVVAPTLRPLDTIVPGSEGE